MRARLIVTSFLIAAASALAQHSKLSDRVIWSHGWDRGFPTAATIDSKGTLWIVTGYQGDDRLASFSPDGRRLSNIDLLSATPAPVIPASGRDWLLAASPSGPVGLLTAFNHIYGRSWFFDGAAFATLGDDGTPSRARQVAQKGMRITNLVALNDGCFLVLADLDPALVTKINPTGDAIWQRTFSRDLVGASAAALPDGSACILIPERRSRILHLLQLDKSGKTNHEVRLDGHRGRVAARGNSCAVLVAKEEADARTALSITAFDEAFHSTWTLRLPQRPRSGARLSLIALRNSYLLGIGDPPTGVLAGISSSGQNLWSVEDAKLASTSFIVPFGDEYFLVGWNPVHGFSLEIARGQ